MSLWLPFTFILSACSVLIFTQPSNARLTLTAILVIVFLKLFFVGFLKLNVSGLSLDLVILCFILFGAILFYFIQSVVSGKPIHYYMVISLLMATISANYISTGSYKNLTTLTIALSFLFTYLLLVVVNVDLSSGAFENRNLITSVTVPCIFTLLLMYKYFNIPSKKIIIFFALFSFIISVLSMGRSGILAHSLLLLSSLFICAGKSKITIKYKYFIVILAMLIAYSFLDLLKIFPEIKKFGERLSYFKVKGFEDSARVDIISEFFHNLKIGNIVFGDYDGSLFVADYNGNLHNTFLTFISNFGIFGVILLVLLVSAIIYSASKDIWLFIAVIAVLIRSGTDTGNDYFTLLGLMLIIFLFAFEKSSNYSTNNLTLTYRQHNGFLYVKDSVVFCSHDQNS